MQALRVILIISLILIFPIQILAVDPGHSATSVSPGTFSAGGNYTILDSNFSVGNVFYVDNDRNQFILNQGSNTTPSISFVNDYNTGIYQPNTANIAFVINGTELFRINRSQTFQHQVTFSTGVDVMLVGATSPGNDFQIQANIVSFLNPSGGTSVRIYNDVLHSLSGTQSAPSLTYEGDEDTGFYRPGEDTIAITAGGNTILYINGSSSNFGFGTVKPLNLLHLNDSSNPQLLLSDEATNASLHAFDGGAGSDSFIDINVNPVSVANNAYVRFFRSTNTSAAVIFQVHRGDGTATPNAQIAGNGDTYFAANNGNVGINISEPTQTLTVAGQANITDDLILGRNASISEDNMFCWDGPSCNVYTYYNGSCVITVGLTETTTTC